MTSSIDGVPSMISAPRAFHRYMQEKQVEAKEARIQALGKSYVPSSLDPAEAADYWNFLTKGTILDVRI